MEQCQHSDEFLTKILGLFLDCGGLRFRESEIPTTSYHSIQSFLEFQMQ
ncbi:hypothetical protein NMS_0606 [Nonlabens marinus S1-08]|uniref:Uncharacterized protein n=1 Tax=Nonlabens marinus S1-08 TaxID=1454201 RepID=W8VPP9_9FLAO|nr:hypothetical protein NMS_0606 [Nonlabens marinus S1-08]